MSRRLRAALLALAPVGALAATSPESNYMLHCMGCHVADGSGAPGKVPSVRDSLPRLAGTPAGRRYLVQVPGAAQSTLSDPELAQVLSWMVRSLSATPVPPSFRDFSAEEVAAYRRTPFTEVARARTQLLSAGAPQS